MKLKRNKLTVYLFVDRDWRYYRYMGEQVATDEVIKIENLNFAKTSYEAFWQMIFNLSTDFLLIITYPIRLIFRGLTRIVNKIDNLLCVYIKWE